MRERNADGWRERDGTVAGRREGKRKGSLAGLTLECFGKRHRKQCQTLNTNLMDDAGDICMCVCVCVCVCVRRL